MNYFLAIIQNDETCALFKYDNIDDALAKMHTELAYRGAGRTQTLCHLIDSEGGMLRSELWKKEVSE